MDVMTLEGIDSTEAMNPISTIGGRRAGTNRAEHRAGAPEGPTRVLAGTHTGFVEHDDPRRG